MIVDRHSGPAQQTRAMAVHARTLEIYSKLGIAERALELGRRGNAANMWAEGKWTARIPLGDIGKSMSPFPFVLILGQDDNERIMGDHLRNWGLAVQWNTELTGVNQEPSLVTANAQAARRLHPQDPGRVRRGLRRRAQHGARAFGHHLSRRAVRARVLRRRYRGDRTHGRGRAQRLPVARWISPVLPDARQGPLAGDRHTPKKLRQRDDVTFEELSPDIRREAEPIWTSRVQLVLHLPHPSPGRGEVPRPALLPAR